MKKLYKIKVFNHISDNAYTKSVANEKKAQLNILYGEENISLVEVNADALKLTIQKLHTWSTDDLITVKRNIQEVLNERAMEDDI